MKKTYAKPNAKKISFQFNKVMATSASYCDQGWKRETVLIPWGNECQKCYDDFIWIDSTGEGPKG